MCIDRWRMVLAAAALSLALLGAAAAAPAERPPARCTAALAYIGAPLHAPPADSLFAGLGADMSRPLGGPLGARLDSVAGWILARTGAPAITAAVAIPGEGTWSAARGLARTDPPTPLAPEPLFYWASAGKAFTAAVILQLVEEGRLAYADSLSRWFPDFPNARLITIDHLLTHTSGAFSFNTDRVFRARRGYTPPNELIRIAARHGSDFCPGEHWNYSNTGYVLLARIVERLEGRPFHEVLRTRIIDRLGLHHTVALAPRQSPRGLAVGHVARRPDPDFDPTVPFGAGPIAAAAGDIVRFWQAMLAGRLVRPESIAGAYRQLHPMFDAGTYYGRGVMLTEFRPGDGITETWLGHGGGTPSHKAVFALDVRSRVFVAVAINGDVSAEAAAFRLLQEVRAWRAGGGG